MAFGKVGKLIQLQKEAREMQKNMKKINIDGASGKEDVVVRIDGPGEIIDIDMADELLTIDKKEELIKKLIEAYKNAQKKLQKEMMKDFDMEKMKGMLGM